MDLERYFELRTILQRWCKLLAESIRRRVEASPRLARRVERIYNSEGTDEPFNVWLDRWCRQAAIQFILRILFLRVLEDRELLGATRIRTVDGQRMWAQLSRNLGAASYVQFCFWDAAHLLPDLFEPSEYDGTLPADELVQRFLDDVWRRPDSDRPGWLRFDFRPDSARRDAGFQTRFIGDLYQELDAEIRERYALLQTPDFIAHFILENTLLKRFEEVDFREVTLMDPTCGSGHFEVDAFWMFVARYEAAAGKTREQMTAAERTKIARAIIEKHLFGCDINPYATALTRFRLVLAACDYAQPASLQDFRDLRFNIVTIDSLIPYEKLMAGGVQAGTATARVLGQPDAIERALPVLRRRYHVVVGNPPYILAQDESKREFYRQHYRSAYRGYHLSVPFTERFFVLADEDARIGIIESNAFANRLMGKKLIEEVLPENDLESVVDLSAAYIPGHGTPTLIIFTRKSAPSSRGVLLVSDRKAESAIPSDPSQGRVWQSILTGFVAGPGYTDDYVEVTTRPKTTFSKHPWEFGGAASLLVEKLQSSSTTLSEWIDVIGAACVTRADDVFVSTAGHWRRCHFPAKYQINMVSGEDIRDWRIAPEEVGVFPYTPDLEAIDVEQHPELRAYLGRYRSLLENRIAYGKTQLEHGLKWSEYNMLFRDRLKDDQFLAFAEIATHNHFAVNVSDCMFRQTAPIVRLKPDVSHDRLYAACAILNCSVTCFFLKQMSYNKGGGPDPIRDRYAFTGDYIARMPLPKAPSVEADWSGLRRLATELDARISSLSTLETSKIFNKGGEAYVDWYATLKGYSAPDPTLPIPFTTARGLRVAREQLLALRQDIRGRMIFLQEEMDWLAYEMYGLIKKAPLAEDYLSPSQYRDARLELGQRPFELAGKGYTGDWPSGYQPAPLPDYLHSLADARIALIRANADITLLEDPLYKRRWVPPDYDAEFREAAAWWLAEKLEFALEQAGRPLSLREWARLMGHDERVNATLEVLTGTPSFDLEAELLKVIRANAVPNRPEHYLKAAGLRKVYAALDERRRTTDNRPPPVPEFAREDFTDAIAWRLRGKLNIPRERFIHYAEFDSSRGNGSIPESGGPWFGWAGWDAAGRADALAHLLDRAQRAGWEVRWRQCGLRAALRDLLPELKELSPADRAEFESIAGICGIGLGTTCYCQAYRDAFARRGRRAGGGGRGVGGEGGRAGGG